MTLQKLNIQPKVDNAAKQKMVTSNEIGVNETLLASEVNQMVETTNKLVDGFNQISPITGYNFKSNVATYADLATVVNPQLNDAYGVLADGLTYIYNGVSFPAQGNGQNFNLKPLGTVSKTDVQAVSGKEVYGKTLTKEKVLTEPTIGTENIYDSSFIKDGYNLNSLGVESVSANRQILSLHPCPGNADIAFAGWTISYAKNICFYDKNKVFISAINKPEISFTVKSPVNAAFVSANTRTDVATQPDVRNLLSIIVPKTVITEIDNKKIKASELTFEALKSTDLTFTGSDNLADKDLIILDKLIGSDGNIFDGVGWRMIAINVSLFPLGAPITFGGFTIATSGYSAFYLNNVLVKNNGVFTNANLPKVVTKTVESDILYIDCARPSNTDEDWKFLTVNAGNTLLPYSDPKGKVSKIKGHDLVGAMEEVNQNPTYNSVTANVANFGVLDIKNVPVWDEVSPTTIVAGEFYAKVDGSNFHFKIKG